MQEKEDDLIIEVQDDFGRKKFETIMTGTRVKETGNLILQGQRNEKVERLMDYVLLALILLFSIFCVFLLFVGILESNFTFIGFALVALMCLLFTFQLIRHDEHPQHYLIKVFEHGIEMPSRNLTAAFEGKTEYFPFADIEEMRYESYLEPLCVRLISGETLFVENGCLGMNVRKSDIVEQWKKYRSNEAQQMNDSSSELQ